MIYKNSKLLNGDNTGIKKVKTVGIKKNSPVAALGDIILFSIRKTKKKKNYIKKKMYFGLIISVKKKTKRLDGTYIIFNNNMVLTLTENFKFTGTRVLFPVAKEIKNTKKKIQMFKKILSLSQIVI